MLELIRLIACVLMVAAVVLAAALLEPELAGGMGLPKWNLEDSEFAQQKRAAELNDAKCAKKQQYFEDRSRLIQKVLGGGATFFEAAAAFDQMNEKQVLEKVEQDLAGCSDEEIACRQVIRYLKASGAEGADLLAQRFEGELREHMKEHNGAVVLTGPNAHYSE
jgi:hypothetical protein